MTADQITQNGLHARIEQKQNIGRPIVHWTDNMNEDITSLGLSLKELEK